MSHIIERARPQVTALALNANGDPARFAEFGLPVVGDSIDGFVGPLAGILAGLDWTAASLPDATHLVSFPGDAPFLPRDLAARLEAVATHERCELACAASAGRTHPVCGLWPIGLREDLRRAIAEEGIRKVDVWTARYSLATAEFSVAPVDPFFNANRPDDLEEAEMIARSLLPELG